MKYPFLVENVKDMLKDMNLEKYQKHHNFHILKVEDHIGEINNYSNIISKHIFEISYGANYDLEMSVDNTNYNTKEGHLTFLAPGQSFYMDIPEGDPSTKKGKGIAYLVFFTSDFLPLGPTDYSIIQKFPYFNRHSSPIYFIKGKVERLCIEYLKKIYQEFQKLDENNIEIIRSYLIILLYEIKRLLEEKIIQNTKVSRAEEITFLFENLLKITSKKRQKIHFYANKLNVSSVYLAECVRKTTGNSPKKIITEYVIMEAKSLLINSTNSIEQIGETLGFDEVSNFTNYFKKNTGLTPNGFKKSE